MCVCIRSSKQYSGMHHVYDEDDDDDSDVELNIC